MKLSNRRIKKVKQKLRDGRTIGNPELVILNRFHKKEFEAIKFIKVSNVTSSSALQIALIQSQPTPLFAVPIEERDWVKIEFIKTKALKIAEVTRFAHDLITTILSEQFKPWSRKAYLEVYHPTRHVVGHYSSCIDSIPPPVSCEPRPMSYLEGLLNESHEQKHKLLFGDPFNKGVQVRIEPKFINTEPQA